MKLIHKLLTAITLIISPIFAGAQSAPFDIALEPVTISGLGGLQAYSFGQAGGKWLIVGGRLDGLHRRQPWATFDIAGHNTSLIVVDPVSQQSWTAPMTSLPQAIQEQLSSTNMEFFQENGYLYCFGGYGYSATLGDHTTYPYLTAIKLADAINAIINNSSFTTYFRQISDPQFQITGGRLKKIYNTWYLLGGQKFLGRYNPMGPNNGPGFIQEYTNSVKRFDLTDNGTNITINWRTPYFDTVELHRRDYNAEPQIMPNGEEGITMFSGVFQPTVDLPFLQPVNVDSSGFAVNTNFQQYYNHYHCPTLPVYSAAQNEMHTIFFGGIAQFFDSSGILVQDNNAPFVKTIARVTRTANGTMAEYKLPVEMPGLLGASAEFIHNLALPQYPNEVLDLDQLTADTTLAGYIYGGISSTAPNVFWVNDGTQSIASSVIYKVLLIRNSTSSVHQLNQQSKSSLQMMVYPNPSDGHFMVKYFLKSAQDVHLQLINHEGRKVEDITLRHQPAGDNSYRFRTREGSCTTTYMLILDSETEHAAQKIIVDP